MEIPAETGRTLLDFFSVQSKNGHGDVIRGQESQWSQGLSPWRVTPDGDRLYGRGSADMKAFIAIALSQARQFLESDAPCCASPTASSTA